MIDYYLITKPGIIMGNLVTFAAGFLLASRGHFDIQLFMITLVALGLIIASACVFNNYIDRFSDQKMERTKKRALAEGKIKERDALIFAIVLAAAGNVVLFEYTNLLTLAIANVGFGVYVLIYSFIKRKTVHSTLIGSISGAVPPVVGYCAVSGRVDIAAVILFLVMIFWQMPHFFAIALWHCDDYAKAGIPVLPVSHGVLTTKIQMALYIVGLIPLLGLFTWFGYTGNLFLLATLALGLVWLCYGLWGFNTDSNVHWGKQMFRLSLAMINVVCLMIFLNF
ncbi:MAG: protoheme IX farnesyltransferase [Chlamydiales bacterium]|nr:heme o synthase [Chlamydiia bacterium]MCP5507899.1 protoheme IX farnesyltransferase [Chlamydiales bacterium]